MLIEVDIIMDLAIEIIIVVVLKIITISNIGEDHVSFIIEYYNRISLLIQVVVIMMVPMVVDNGNTMKTVIVVEVVNEVDQIRTIEVIN
jgi:hypothetical protein